MTDYPSDLELDALLRDVPLPEGFAQRLHEALVPSDERLDDLLSAVPLPSTVLSRLKEIPADAALDEKLVNLPQPHGLIHRLRRTIWTERWRRVGLIAQRGVMAASWFAALSAMLAALALFALQRAIPKPEDPLDMVVIYDGPFSLTATMDGDLPTVGLKPEDSIQSPDQAAALAASQALNDLAELDLTEVPPAGPVGQWMNLVNSGLRPLDDAVLLRYGVLGSPQYADDALPELIAPRLPRPTGIEPPRVRGYDRAFFLKHRVFPRISPAANPQLAAIDVPLVTFSDVLSRLERSLAEGRLPQAAEIRTEELLAAMDYRLPAAPAGKLAIRTAAGPSLFGGPEAGLLQVGVQAGGLASRPQRATHMVLAIDLSHSMAAAGRLEMLQSSIGRLLDQLGPRDRLSLVVFDEEVRQVIEAATRNEAAAIREALAALSPRGGTNLAAGLQQAASLAMSDVGDQNSAAARRLVLITDSEPLLPPETAASVAQMLAEAEQADVRLDVLDVSYREQVSTQLTEWARGLSGYARRIEGGRQLYRSLLEALGGRDPAIAHDAKLTLRFNPKAVSAYRLIGHEANALVDVSPPAVEAEILAGEAATALVELWFTPQDTDDLGTAELTWNDTTSQPQRVRQRISRVQFATSAREAPLPLLQAALAAQVGEVLHGSHDVLRQAGLRPANSRGLEGVLTAAGEANPRLHERADFERLLGLVRELERHTNPKR